MDNLQKQAEALMAELLQKARCNAGDLLVLGCSTSEVLGQSIGTMPSINTAAELMHGFLPLVQKAGLYLAVQCCEHLNRALVVEKEALLRHGLPRVNALPQPKAGGSAATAAWAQYAHPVLAETLLGRATAGLDVGDTLIGMHLCPVAVPLRLAQNRLGAAHITAARTRPKFVGGARAVYDETLL